MNILAGGMRNPLNWFLKALEWLNPSPKWVAISLLMGSGLFLTVFCYVNPHAVLDTFNIEIADTAEQGIELNLKAGGTVSGVLFGSFWMILGIYNSWQANALKVVSGTGRFRGYKGFNPPVNKKVYKNETRVRETYNAEFDCWDNIEYEKKTDVLADTDLSEKYKEAYGTDQWLLEDLTRLKIKKDHDVKTHWLSALYLVVGLAAITVSCLFGTGIIELQGTWMNVAFSVPASVLFLGTSFGLMCYHFSEVNRKQKGVFNSMNRKGHLVEKINKVNQRRDTGYFWKPAQVTTSVSSAEKYKVNRLEKEYSKWKKDDSKKARLRKQKDLYESAIKNKRFVVRNDFSRRDLDHQGITMGTNGYGDRDWKFHEQTGGIPEAMEAGWCKMQYRN